MRKKIETVLQEIIQPLIQIDGGNIELISAENNTVVLELSGKCSGCPGKPYTLSGIIEPLLKKTVGESVTIRYQYKL